MNATDSYNWTREWYIFTTKSAPSPPSSPPSSPPPPSPPPEEPLTLKEKIEERYNVTLNQNFTATDTDEDSVVDTFTDPNYILISIRFAIIDGNASFLLAVNGGIDKLFLWDTGVNCWEFWDEEDDKIPPVLHSIATVIDDTGGDDETGNKIVNVTIEKANWTYFEATDLYPPDQYPDYALIVKRSNGTIVPSNLVWRENSRVYVLDDPATEYLLIYSYETDGFLFDVILELTPESIYEGEDITALITLINVGEPGLVNATVSYTLYKGEEIIWSEEEDLSILGQLAFSKTIATAGFNPGTYTYEVVHRYGDNQTASAQDVFTVNAQPGEGIPLWILIVLVVIIIIILIIAFLFKTGYLSLAKKIKK